MLTRFQHNVQKCTSAESKICITSASSRTSLFLQSSLDDIPALLNSGATLLLSAIKINAICAGIIPFFTVTLFSGHTFSFLLGVFVENKQQKVRDVNFAQQQSSAKPPKSREQLVLMQRASSQLLTAYTISETD